MLWSLLKIVAFIAIAVAIAFGATWILQTRAKSASPLAGARFCSRRSAFLSPSWA